MKEERGFFRGYVIGVLLPAVAFVVLFQTLLFRPYRIPSESMLPNLLVGDYILVSKFSYGYSRFSLPFTPRLFEGRLWGAVPKRGDVAVFRPTPSEDKDFVKRVVGLPGDTIQMVKGVLHINGSPVRLARTTDYALSEDGVKSMVPQYRETMPEGHEHMVLDLDPTGDLDDTPAYKVPAGNVFMMGDNRDDSADSRVPEIIGFVPMENIVGRVEAIFFSVSEGAPAWQFWRWPWTIRFGRIPTLIK